MESWQTVRYIPSPNKLAPLRQQCGEFTSKKRALDLIPSLREAVDPPFQVFYRVEQMLDGKLVASFSYESPLVAIPPEPDRRKVWLTADDIYQEYE